MILSQDDILEIIGKPRNVNITDWRDKHEQLDLFKNGGDVAARLELVKNFENAEQRKLRQKLGRSTKDLTSYLLKPLDKVFSASGGNSDILGSDTVRGFLTEYLSELPHGISLGDWMRHYWVDAFITDPNGLIFIESDKNGNAYPTYKSIKVVHDYIKKWEAFEYVVFDAGKGRYKESDVQLYRVVDDQKDGIYFLSKERKLMEYGEVIEHGKGFVPAINPSNIPDKKTGGKLSFIHPIDEVLEEYMRDSSVHTIYKFLHGFPKYWQYATKCTTCQGAGKIKDSNTGEKKTCPTCKGGGLKKTHDVSDGISIPLPKEGETMKLAPDLAGYVQPALETWAKQVEEMSRMRQEMHFSLWGTVVEEEKSNTATGRFIDVQPVNDTLDKISAIGEWAQGMITDFIGRSMLSGLYMGNLTHWGRRYMIETPDTLWEKYLMAKERQAPISTLDYFYDQFLMAEYHNDHGMMDQKTKEFNIEPFPHYSLADLSKAATPMQLQKKIIFSEWTSIADYTKDIETLKKEFDDYFKNYIKDGNITEGIAAIRGGQAGERREQGQGNESGGLYGRVPHNAMQANNRDDKER